MSDGPGNKTPDLCRMLFTAVAMISMIGEVIIMPIPEIRISITLFAARWSTASPIFLDTRSGVSKRWMRSLPIRMMSEIFGLT